jgi:two-component system alkaline phosphatase synthesis response regulator PhoP
VDTADNGDDGLFNAEGTDYDAIILDVMLPGMDGFSVCETMRREGRDTPVLFLTAKGGPNDRIRGLEAGGDDYLPKPFQLRELLLRVSAILRRRVRYDAVTALEPVVRFGGNEFDFRNFRGRSFDGRDQLLTQKEAMILKELVQRRGAVIWRDELLEKVWGDDVLPSTRTIDNFVMRLRKRFEPDPEKPRHFHTVRGIGYRFSADAEGDAA